MLALKKKREAEAKAKAEEEVKAKEEDLHPPADAPSTIQSAETSSDEAAPTKVSLLGIGGKKKAAPSKNGVLGKKRTPGEIRIQKGQCR